MNALMPRDLFGIIDEVFAVPQRGNRLAGPIRVDVKEDPEKYTFEADLPGVDKNQVKVKFEQGTLTLAVEQEETKEEKEGDKVLRKERFSSFKSRSFYLGDNINDGEIKASYSNGVLTLVVPKHKPTVSVREIAIE